LSSFRALAGVTSITSDGVHRKAASAEGFEYVNWRTLRPE